MNRDMLDITKKARAYDNAIKRAKEWMAGKYGHYDSDTPQEIAEFIFPELKENEDEKMWKAIYNALKYLETELSWDFLDDVDILDVYAWLEKQSNKSQGKSVLEAIKEEKIDNTDNVEPKFHEGDWVVSKFDGKARRISEVHCDEYNKYYIVKENEYNIEEYDRLHRLWTIEDAKDGDVLVASDDSVFIFARVDGYGCIHHIALANDGVLKINPRLIFSWENVKGVKPATKEQCDLLLQKMKEAGYEWNVEKKELKKIEQTIEIPFGAKDSELQEATYYIPEGYHVEINGNVVIIKKGEQKPLG